MELHAYEQLADSVDRSLQETQESAPKSVFPAVTPPGMAYVPYQQWGEVYEPENGLKRGTVFPGLDLPFQGGGCDK